MSPGVSLSHRAGYTLAPSAWSPKVPLRTGVILGEAGVILGGTGSDMASTRPRWGQKWARKYSLAKDPVLSFIHVRNSPHTARRDVMTEDLKFADWLISTGRAMGYATNSALAHAIGVPQPTVSRWKKGAKPSVEHLVSISDLFGIELKTLLVLSGHMQGDVSPGKLAPPPSQADRIIDSVNAPEPYKTELRIFWAAREREELYRLELLAEAVETAHSMDAGEEERKSFHPWIETALATELPLHVQALRNAIEPSASNTWILHMHPSVKGDAHEILMKDVVSGVEATQTIYAEDGWYHPSIRATEGSRFLLRGPSSQSLEETRESLRSMLRNYPTLKLRDLEIIHAPEEEDES